MKRVLVPYFNIGLGHFAFARSVKKAFESLPEPWEVHLMDMGEELPGKMLTNMYVESWRTILAAPKPVKSFLFGLNRLAPWATDLGIARGNRKNATAAAAFLSQVKPDAIVACHWGTAHVLNAGRMKAGIGVPLYYVYGELAGIVPQIRSGADNYFYMTSEAQRALIGIGVRQEQLVQIGLVLQPGLELPLPERGGARRELGLEADRFTVLYALGGEGIGNAFPYLDAYYSNARSSQMLVLTGKNREFQKSIQERYPQRADRGSIVAAGYVPDIKTAYGASDILAGKCGASFAMEAIRYRRPLLVTALGAPNEAHNRDYLVEHGFGYYVPRPEQFVEETERLSRNEAAYQAAIAPEPTPIPHDGATDIAMWVSRHASGTTQQT